MRSKVEQSWGLRELEDLFMYVHVFSLVNYKYSTEECSGVFFFCTDISVYVYAFSHILREKICVFFILNFSPVRSVAAVGSARTGWNHANIHARFTDV